LRLTAEEVIQRFLQPAEPPDATVDRILFGSPQAEVTGIAVTFLASQSVLEQAAALGANFVISHEGIFYSHHAGGDHLNGDPVFLAKRKWIEQSGIVVYRLHDHIHRCRPDGITAGLVKALEWESYVREVRPESSIVRLPELSLRELAAHVKDKLGLAALRVVGDLSMPCSRVGLLAGYRGGAATAIPLLGREDVDAVIAGEGPEWETPEYVRDAMRQGRKKALVLIGHAASEEPGMRALAVKLREALPDIPVRFIADRPVFQIV